LDSIRAERPPLTLPEAREILRDQIEREHRS
jgi:hypothetical protein